MIEPSLLTDEELEQEIKRRTPWWMKLMEEEAELWWLRVERTKRQQAHAKEEEKI